MADSPRAPVLRTREEAPLLRGIQVSTESFSAFKFTAPLATYLRKHGYEQMLACNLDSFSDAPSYRGELVSSGLKVCHVPISRNVSVLGDLRALVRLVVLFRREQPDFVHTHNSKAGVLGRIAARLAGVPRVIHTSYDVGRLVELRSSPIGRLLLWIEQLAGRLGDRTLVIAEDGVEQCLRLGLAPAARIENVGVGVSFDEFNPYCVTTEDRARWAGELDLPQDTAIVGTLARLVPHKGVDTLLKAMPEVLRAHPRVHFVIAGGGPEEARLRSMASDLGIGHSVSFTGFVREQARIPALFATFDIFWLATHWEGFGLVYTEAHAMGKPVVGSAISPVNEVVSDGIDGLLVPPDDVSGFAQACVKLLRDPQLRARMGHSGQARARRLFSEEAVFQRIEAVYKSLGLNPDPAAKAE